MKLKYYVYIAFVVYMICLTGNGRPEYRVGRCIDEHVVASLDLDGTLRDRGGKVIGKYDDQNGLLWYETPAGEYCTGKSSVPKPGYNQRIVGVAQNTAGIPDKKTTMTGEINVGVMCDTKTNRCKDEGAPKNGPYKTLSEARKEIAKLFGGKECNDKSEANYVVFKKDEEYYFGGKSWYDGEKSYSTAPSAEMEYIKEMKEKGYAAVEQVHDHHNGLYQWPTIADAVVVANSGIPNSVYGCNGHIFRVNVDGSIDDIDIENDCVNTKKELDNLPQNELYNGDAKIETLSFEDFKKTIGGFLYDNRKPRFEELKNMVTQWEGKRPLRQSGREPFDDSRHNDNIVDPKPANDDSQFGVRGWCKCGADHGKMFFVGFEGEYAYHLCGRCGKVDRPWRKKGDGGDFDRIRIIDNRIVSKYEERAGRDIPRHQYKAMLRNAEDALLDVPDGQIVIPGKCSCKKPDPIKTGFVDNEEYYVCCSCGKVYVPVDCTVPTGPTAWREMMGPDKPFPGYNNESKKK